jgi:hypothetical protein
MRIVAVFCLLLVCLGLPAAEPVPPVAARFLALFDQLRDAQARPSASRPRVTVALPEQDLNEYMKYSLRATPRPGLESTTIKIFPQNYISTFAVVDFDAIEKWKPGTIPTLLRPVLRGKQSVWVDYRFGTENSTLKFSVEKAYFGSLRLPSFLVEKMIAIVASRQPEHYDTSKPLPLPFGLQQLWTEGQTLKGHN